MKPLLHWHETNPKAQAPVAKPKRKHSAYHHGPKAKPIIYKGIVYRTWAEACALTGKTADAIRWAIKREELGQRDAAGTVGDNGAAYKKYGNKIAHNKIAMRVEEE